MSYKKVKLKEVLTHRKGSILIENEKDYKLCRVQLHRKGVLLRQIQKGAEIRTKKQQLCKTGDFIVAEMDAKLGGYGLIPEELDGAIVSSHYYLFETNEEKISREFLQVLSQTDAIQKQIKAKGSTNYSSIRPHEVLEFEIYLPPLNEQMNIVKMYKSFYEQQTIFQTELTTQSNLLSKLRQAYLQEAVMGKLTEPSQDNAQTLLKAIKSQKAELIKQGKLRKEKPFAPIKPEEIPFEIPDNWIWCRLGEIGEVKRGKSPIYSNIGDFTILNQKCVRWFDVEVEHGKVVNQEWYKNLSDDSLLEEFDVLVNSTGDGTIGRSAIANEKCKGLPFDSHILRIRSIVESRYICYFINSNFGQQLVSSTKGATSTKQTELGVNNLNNFPIPLPSLSEQKAIVAKVEGLLGNISLLESENKAQQIDVQRLMGAVLQEAFGGR